MFSHLLYFSVSSLCSLRILDIFSPRRCEKSGMLSTLIGPFLCPSEAILSRKDKGLAGLLFAHSACPCRIARKKLKFFV